MLEKAAKKPAVEVVENLKGGIGKITINREETAYDPKILDAGTLNIPPGGSIGWHEHTDDNEIWEVLSGIFEYKNENGTEILEPDSGKRICRKGKGHAGKNIGLTEAVIRFVKY